jgi:prepilin-type processing-associated H-X9-DG protein
MLRAPVEQSAARDELLDRHRDQQPDELWLDHDLGEGDTIRPVVEILERARLRAAQLRRRQRQLPPNRLARKNGRLLRHWAYRVHTVSGSTNVGYLDGHGGLTGSMQAFRAAVLGAVRRFDPPVRTDVAANGNEPRRKAAGQP